MGVRQQGSAKVNFKGSPRFPPLGPRRPHTWLDDRHGMRRDVRRYPFLSFPFPLTDTAYLVHADLSPPVRMRVVQRDALRDGV
jgi:hypothetical protein